MTYIVGDIVSMTLEFLSPAALHDAARLVGRPIHVKRSG
jgi:hypothetical protein